MFVCLDAHYGTAETRAAAVAFSAWADAAPAFEVVVTTPGPAAPYVSGAFAERELAHLLAVLAAAGARGEPSLVIVDAHVWLEGETPGLGARLHAAVEGRFAVVGVAKHGYRGQTRAVAVTRGASEVPLHVTAVGAEVSLAAEGVRAMHGAHRIPTLLSRADRLARGLVAPTT